MRKKTDEDTAFNVTVDEDEIITFGEEEVSEGLKECQTSIIGKLITNKNINPMWIQSAMANIWGNPEGFRVKEIKPKIYQFFFKKQTDLAKWTLTYRSGDFRNTAKNKAWRESSGVAGHDTNSCEIKAVDDKEGRDRSKNLGPWLKAETNEPKTDPVGKDLVTTGRSEKEIAQILAMNKNKRKEKQQDEEKEAIQQDRLFEERMQPERGEICNKEDIAALTNITIQEDGEGKAIRKRWKRMARETKKQVEGTTEQEQKEMKRKAKKTQDMEVDSEEPKSKKPATNPVTESAEAVEQPCQVP
ncbi:hypothetical protein PIB30_099670 [Stylosanthes scabra]|uniref:DUF4283 domain-containing protein n=1 Tax=Stylosanthes scabra TaxID=79078 RepID=A0ABU6UVW6_9FABA|nr:hypothetical protein [Stylosanthes scabra]